MDNENETDAIIEAFIDDAGNTGGDLGNLDQRNLVLASVVVPYKRARAFWSQAGKAWEIASSVTGGTADMELKGKELFGGRGPFKGVRLPDRCRVLDAVADAVISQKTYVFWEGLPKHLWSQIVADIVPRPPDLDFSKTMLQAFLSEAYAVLDRLYGPHAFRVTADENSWVPAGKVLSLRGAWPRLLNGGVIFDRSSKVRGLQIADILAHALYRANKSSCPDPDKAPVTISSRDKLAASYVEKLAARGVLVPLTQAAAELPARHGSPVGS